MRVKRKDIGCVREPERSEAPGKTPKGTNRPKGCNTRGNRGKVSLGAKDEGFLIRVAHSEGQTV